MSNQNDSTNEGKFFESLRAFMKEVPGLTEEPKRKDLARVIENYDGTAAPKDDPLYRLFPSVAVVIRHAQEAAAPDLAGHPFFLRVAEISRVRFSRDIQEIFDANNYLAQRSLGIRPEIGPSLEAIDLVLNARKKPSFGGKMFDMLNITTRKGEVRQHVPTSLRLEGVIEAFKRNW